MKPNDFAHQGWDLWRNPTNSFSQGQLITTALTQTEHAQIYPSGFNDYFLSIRSKSQQVRQSGKAVRQSLQGSG